MTEFKGAACTDKDRTLFFPVVGNSAKAIAKAKAICAECPVRQACLEAGLQDERHGVWGGLTAKERMAHPDWNGDVERPLEGAALDRLILADRKPPEPIYGPSQYRGVSRKSKRWRAEVSIRRGRNRSERYSAGFFDTELEAARARDALVMELGLSPKQLNFPEEWGFNFDREAVAA